MNPTRAELAEKFRKLIDEYNNGTLNIEEILRRLREISNELSDEETRAVREDLTEHELAIFDLLTKPEPELNDKERNQVKETARKLLEIITERLVLDWRRHSQTRSAVEDSIKKTLDSELPDVYDKISLKLNPSRSLTISTRTMKLGWFGIPLPLEIEMKLFS